MKQYSRVSYEVRCQIDAFLQAKFSIPEIAKRLGYHKTTIYRELKRNSQLGLYTPKRADVLSNKRYKNCRKKTVLTGAVLNLLEGKLIEGWSPEQISGRLRFEFKTGPSHTTIYKFINSAKGNKKLKPLLRTYNRRGAGRLRQRRSIYNLGPSIRQRPVVANERRRLGDWERDTMHTLNAVQILVCTDRKSRLTKIARLANRTNKEVDRITQKLIDETGKRAFTITNDNGADFKGENHLKIPVYYCEPLKPQQRGTVENTIGLLRQYIGRKTNAFSIDLETIEKRINMRPRKVLGYKTPYEVYFKKKVALAILT